MKICSKCKCEKQDDSFHPKSYWCRPCNALAVRNRRALLKSQGIKRVVNRDYRKNSPRELLGASLRHALKRRPTDNPVTINDLMELWEHQNGKCAVSGIGMVWSGDGNSDGKIRFNSVSIDRIDNLKGYHKGNIRLVCYCLNAFMMDMTDVMALDVAKAFVNHMETLRRSQGSKGR